MIWNKFARNIDQKAQPNKKPLLLLILDGWGIAPDWGGNAIAIAKTPNFDRIWRQYPKTTLLASGTAVGQPQGAPGNSEAGHLNIGAGRIVHQDLPVIDQQIEDGRIEENPTLKNVLEHRKKNNSKIHLVGLLTKTGVHSHIKHLYVLLNFLKKNGLKNVYIHLFYDGRDSDPMSGIELIDEVERKIKEIGVGRVVSLMGRFYAMDRDNRWGRTARAYSALTKGEGEKAESLRGVFAESYSKGITDEFIQPRIITNKDNHFENISDGDSVVLFNYRADRVRQLSAAFLADELPQIPDRLKLKNIYFASFVTHESENIGHTIFQPDQVKNPLGAVLSAKGLSQFHIAETEKYAHVTYFINGRREEPFPKETRKLIPSPNVRTYDHAPQMGVAEITKEVLDALSNHSHHVYIINFANADMVGHTGNFDATVIALQHVDKCLGSIVEKVAQLDGTLLVTADHGNAEEMVNASTGEPHTEHTTNPVPFIIVDNNLKDAITLKSNGSLSHISPTILSLLNVQKPEDMASRESLIIQKDTIRR